MANSKDIRQNGVYALENTIRTLETVKEAETTSHYEKELIEHVTIEIRAIIAFMKDSES